MATIKGSLIEGIRGKFHGLVGSANASGSYVRMYKKPTNPNSQAQQDQRNRFRNMSGGFNALTQSIQQGWAVFANTNFNPLRKTNKGQFTAIMAFKAIKLLVIGNNERFIPFTATYDLATPTVVLTSLAVAMPISAPINSVRPNIYNTATENIPLQLTTSTITSAGACTATIAFAGVPAAGLTGTEFKDENGTKLGFTFYISEPVHGIGYRCKNPYNQNLGFTQIIQTATTSTATHKQINFTWNCATLKAKFKRFPLVGEVVQMTACVVGDNGTISSLGSVYVTIT